MRPNLLRSLLGMEEGPNGDEGPNPRGFYGPPLGRPALKRAQGGGGSRETWSPGVELVLGGVWGTGYHSSTALNRLRLGCGRRTCVEPWSCSRVRLRR